MATIKPKWIHKPGLIPVKELPVGKFGSINGHIVYRHSPAQPDRQTWLPGILFVEHHNHTAIYDGATTINNEWTYLVEPIDKPNKKHCDNAIDQIRKLGRDGRIDGLAYVDHMYSLKQHIKEFLNERTTKTSS